MLIFVGLCAFFSSLVSFYSGFGLGTLLMPAIALFFPLPVAITLTAVVHLFHNALKSMLLWRYIDWSVAIRFGGAAAAAALPGALLLSLLSDFGTVYSYSFFGIPAHISLLHGAIGLLFLVFASIECVPHKMFQIRSILLGGALSGFFGGFSGNQGAFRSLFLVNTDLRPQSFVATNACIALFVDVVRLGIYGINFMPLLLKVDTSLLAVAVIMSSFAVFCGVLFLQKMTSACIQRAVIVLFYLFGVSFLIGIL